MIAACIGAFMLPLVIAILLSEGSFDRVLPDLMPAPGDPSLTPRPEIFQLLSDIASIMISMAIGLGIAAGWLYRQPLKHQRRHTPAALLSTTLLLAFVSIYSGLRFKYDLAAQLNVNRFDLDKLNIRTFWQGTSLILETSMLCVSGVIHYFQRDRRHGFSD